MYANDINLNASTYKSFFSTTSSGRLYVPVKSNVAVYTQFEHVRGTPAENGQRGVPVDRIRILNTLIDQLISMKKDAVPKEDVFALTDSQKDALIQSYQKEIQRSLSVAQLPGTYGLAGLLPEPGALFNFTV